MWGRQEQREVEAQEKGHQGQLNTGWNVEVGLLEPGAVQLATPSCIPTPAGCHNSASSVLFLFTLLDR